ncbi:MAG: hypothetical protein Q3972_09020 [Corynebacterium sp.]|nr:hypothetical protein [Corynebacterium sp.]
MDIPDPQKVILIHGGFGHPMNFRDTPRRLEERGHEVRAMKYGMFGLAPFPECVRQARQTILDWDIDTAEWTIVAHSLGGMVAGHLANEFAFRRLIGLGACFRGLPPTAFMRKDLADPVNFPDLHSVRTELVALVSSHDEVVPEYSSVLPEYLGTTYRVYGRSHTALPNSPEIVDLVEAPNTVPPMNGSADEFRIY